MQSIAEMLSQIEMHNIVEVFNIVENIKAKKKKLQRWLICALQDEPAPTRYPTSMQSQNLIDWKYEI